MSRTASRLAPGGLALLALPAAAQLGGPLDAPLVVADDRKQIVKTLDLDGDGWTDAFGWWTDGAGGADPGEGNMHGWINDRTGRLVLAWNVPYSNLTPEGIPAEQCDVADLDGDGDDDWVLVTANQLRAYRSQGALPPVLAATYSGSSWFDAVVLADFDDDGRLELATVGGSKLTTYELQLTSGTITPISTRSTGFVSTGPLLAAELSGDLTPDLLVSGTRLFPVVGGVIQQHTQHFPVSWDWNSGMFMHDAGDVDGDGDLDVVTFYAPDAPDQAGGYRILWRTAPDSLSSGPALSGGPARELADVDGDGDPDGVCCGGGPNDPSRNLRRSTFRVALNDGDGGFAPALEWPGLGSRAIAGAADLDHDGDLDLVGGRNVYYAQGPIREHPHPIAGTQAQSPGSLADLDGDGDIDVEPGLDGLWRNRGDATLEHVALDLPPPPPGQERQDIAFAADWYGGPDTDLLVPLGDFAFDGLELLVGVGAARFLSRGMVAGPQGFGTLTAAIASALPADVDGDGDLDLVLRTLPGHSPARSAWWRNDNGGNAFVYQAEFLGLRIDHVGDLSGDGLPDLVGVGPPSGGLHPVHWSPGLGGGAFGAWIAIAGTDVRPWRDHFSVGDLDLDGDLDLATTLWGQPPKAQILWNDSQGNFTIQVVAPILEWGHEIELLAMVADPNGDGHQDLIVGPLDEGPNCLAVLLRSGDNSGFLTPAEHPILVEDPASGIWHTDFAAADLDGDGDQELLGERRYDALAFRGKDAGSRLQFDDGEPGLGGVVPLLGATGPFRVGERVTVHLRGLRPGAAGVLSIHPTSAKAIAAGLRPLARELASAPTERFLFSASGTQDAAAGSGSWDYAFTVDPGQAGETWILSARMSDAAAAAGHSISNSLLLSYGP